MVTQTEVQLAAASPLASVPLKALPLRLDPSGCQQLSLPVILVTGYAEELERTRGVDVRVLSKPFDIALLEKMLEAIQHDRQTRVRRERDATL